MAQGSTTGPNPVPSCFVQHAQGVTSARSRRPLAHVHAVWHRAATMPIRSDMMVCLARDPLDLAAGPSAPASQAVCSPQCGAYEVRPSCNPKSARGFILCSGAWGSVTHLSKQVVALLVKAVANPSSNGMPAASQAVCGPQCGAYEVRPPCNPKSARGFILCSGAWGSVTHLSKQVVALLVKAVANPSSNGLQI